MPTNGKRVTLRAAEREMPFTQNILKVTKGERKEQTEQGEKNV